MPKKPYREAHVEDNKDPSYASSHRPVPVTIHVNETILDLFTILVIL